MTLFEWLAIQPRRRARPRTVLRIGPKGLRGRAQRDAAFGLLEQAGLVLSQDGHWQALSPPSACADTGQVSPAPGADDARPRWRWSAQDERWWRV